MPGGVDLWARDHREGKRVRVTESMGGGAAAAQLPERLSTTLRDRVSHSRPVEAIITDGDQRGMGHIPLVFEAVNRKQPGVGR